MFVHVSRHQITKRPSCPVLFLFILIVIDNWIQAGTNPTNYEKYLPSFPADALQTIGDDLLQL